jgi:sugar phosphate isomerase/epimerase
VDDTSRLSLNQWTVQPWSLREAVDGCVRGGIAAIGIWREKVAEIGLATSVQLVRSAGLHVSSLCRGGWFDAPTPDGRRQRMDDNRRAVDEAAALEADTLVLVCGPALDRDLVAGRRRVASSLEELAPYARSAGVRLAIEPMHPIFAADRSVVVTLGEALQLAAPYRPQDVGVIVDAYHVWWDPELYTLIASAGERIHSFQVCDWILPLPDMLLGRGMMGDGYIDLPRMRRAVDAAGYGGFIEVEIFNQALWDMPGDAVLALTKERFLGKV